MFAHLGAGADTKRSTARAITRSRKTAEKKQK